MAKHSRADMVHLTMGDELFSWQHRTKCGGALPLTRIEPLLGVIDALFSHAPPQSGFFWTTAALCILYWERGSVKDFAGRPRYCNASCIIEGCKSIKIGYYMQSVPFVTRPCVRASPHRVNQ